MATSFWKSLEEEKECCEMEARRMNNKSTTTNQVCGDNIIAPLKLTTVGDLIAEPDEKMDWVVEGLLSRGGVSLIAAKPKTGKSTLMRQLACCVARGEDFLGRSTFKGLVIYLALEERRNDVRNHFRLMDANENDELKIFAGMAPQEGIKKVRLTVEQEKPVLIVVDTLARLARIKDFNDYAQTTSSLEPFLAMAREIGAHVCLVHHAKKGQDKSIDSILGSTGLAGSVDTIIILNRGEQHRTISSIQRVGEDIPETVINFDKEKRWSDLGGSKEEAEIERVEETILEFLQNQTEAITEKIIDEEVEGKRAYKKKSLRQLVEKQKISRFGTGKKGDPYLYKLPEKNTGILVPEYTEEPEKQNPQNGITNQKINDYSGSREIGPFQNSENQHFDQDAAIEATGEWAEEQLRDPGEEG